MVWLGGFRQPEGPATCRAPKIKTVSSKSAIAAILRTMGERNKENDGGAAAGVGPEAPASAGGSAAPFVIPPLTKSSTGLQRRQELAERDRSLTAKLNEISLQSSTDDDNSNTTSTAKTPGKKTKGGSSNAPKTPGATPGRPRPAPVAMPSPGLRRIRERLGDEANSSLSSDTFGGKHQPLSREDLLAREQAMRAMAEAERSAAAAIDAIFAQQEGTLLAMSAALKADESNGNSILLDRIAKAVEETTREQLAALSGVSKEGDDILQTAVYWITLARFESNHGREEAARKYLTDGIACMEAKRKESVGGAVVASNVTQISALRLALDRMVQKMQTKKKGGEMEEDRDEEENEKMAAEVEVEEVAKPKPRLPPSAKVNKSPSRRRSRSKNKEEAPVTPTRRSDRIKAKSAEKEKK